MAIRTAKRKEEPAQMSAAAKLVAAKDELLRLRKQEALLLAARLETERARTSSQRDLNVIVEARKASFKVERAQNETELLAVQARAERAKSPEAKSEADALIRQRGLVVVALRQINAAIDELAATGAHIPADLASVPSGFTRWSNLLLGSKDCVGLNGKAAQGYIGELVNLGLLRPGEDA